MPRQSDLSTADFERLLKHHGFAALRSGQFVDLRAPARTGSERGIFRGRRLQRQATLEALLQAREARETAQAAADAAQAERERVAAAIAPTILPPPRNALEGPAAIAQLADDFVLISTRNEGATLPDLIRMGWRRTQVLEHADAARALAYTRQGGAMA